MRALEEIWIALRVVFDLIFTEYTEVIAKLTSVRGDGRTTEMELCLRGFRKLFVWGIIAPFVVFVAGVILDFNWLISIATIIWSIGILVLALLAAPLPILLDAAGKIIGKSPKILKRYYDLVLVVLAAELSLAIFATIVPIRNNPSAIPIVIIASILLGIFALLGIKNLFTKKLMVALTSIIFVFYTLSFFLPQTFKTFKEARVEMDEKMAAIVKGERPLFAPKPAPHVPSYQRIARKDFIGLGFGGLETKIHTGWTTPDFVRKGDKVKFIIPEWGFIEASDGKKKVRYPGPLVEIQALEAIGSINFRASKGAEGEVELWGIR